ncbi:unnamed protein product [Allacma fusca]|uniref:Dual oxidase maturation factor 1 n=2 Tax=Allacma fusca TaxID=39272 RepID=A0A8J2JMQ2_9HEXA|nr:unnamed protein product [Allacma fusca]
MAGENCDYLDPLTDSWFSFQREEGYPTRYGDHFNPAHVDVLTAGLILAFLIVAVCFYVILPGFSNSRRWSIFAYVTVSLFIGGVVVVGNYGHEWEVGKVEIISQYKPGSSEELHAHLGLHVALRGINITLKDVTGRNIDYNEHFSWEWGQGRFGFGKYAGRFSREFRAGVLKGLPYPILQVAEYFTFDGEGIRFGRHYRLAGWYAHIFMWSAFPSWIMANVLFSSAVKSGAVLLGLTGVLQLIAIGIWTFLRNPIELGIPFETPGLTSTADLGEVILSTQFGPDYYIVFLNGILCLLLGSTIFLLTEFMPDEMCLFFGIDPLTSYDEYVPSKTVGKPGIGKSGTPRDVEKGEGVPLLLPGEHEDAGQSEYGTSTKEGDLYDENATVLKRRKTSKRFKESIRTLGMKPKVIPRTNVRFQQSPSVAIIEEEKETPSPAINENAKDEMDDSFRDYANIPSHIQLGKK